jgi:hypothetical protein
MFLLSKGRARVGYRSQREVCLGLAIKTAYVKTPYYPAPDGVYGDAKATSRLLDD